MLEKEIMKARPSYPEIKALTQKMNFGKYKGQTIEEIINNDPSYILYLSDEKIAKFSEEILDYAEESESEKDFNDAMDFDWDGIDVYDYMDD